MIAEVIAGSSSGLRSALIAAGLPTEDIENQGAQFFRFSVDGRSVAYGGLEKHGCNVLLRSLVVLPQEQGKGFGKAAVDWLLNEARTEGATGIFLLTSSAEEYFKRFGFGVITREGAPYSIRSTKQAAALCPATATLMSYKYD